MIDKILRVGMKGLIGKRRKRDSINYYDYDYPKMKSKKISDELDGCLKKRIKTIKEGDKVDISEILFDEIDFLIKNNGQQVDAKHLEGKVIVLHFVPLVPWSSNLKRRVETLIDIYNCLDDSKLKVVFIGFKVPGGGSDLQFYFQDKFAIMPWLAVPFSHIKKLSFWERKLKFPLRHHVSKFSTHSLVINPEGLVSQIWADNIFLSFGAEGFPFTDTRIRRLQHRDNQALRSPSITKLLTFHGLDHLITNQHQKVPVKDLEDKVIALYFYEDYDFDDNHFLNQLKDAYHKLVSTKKNFEIVLVYLHHTVSGCKRASESSFSSTLLGMDWLALPYKDPRCKNLERIFEYPCDLEASGPDPRLVIIGPHGKFIEPYGADILKSFGPGAYPFTRKKAAKLDVKSLKNLSVDMFWDQNFSFDKADGHKVKLSQLTGRKIILIIEDGWPLNCPKFWPVLRRRYRDAEIAGYPFEVIRSVSRNTSYSRYVSDSIWLNCRPFREGSDKSSLAHRVFRGGSGLLAFDGDGRVVRRTTFPQIEKGSVHFPFFDGNLEKEALDDLIDCFDWD